ncbi:tRNA lysidine(34) synthetase TilS [Tatumella saanichensis]|uniref:tRNA lysidine(34) synthetase TilS n=1 Tax=Tatumella saanichensis TaxID=480813 RepID=UPI0004A2F36D|nr:tRNA lysidine(34) synthetase TilS [Tatumella saanichensis]
MSAKILLSEELGLGGHQRLLVAFSGGLDSTVLLHCLASLRDTRKLTVRAVHIHHGLSQYADKWAIHCQQVCKQWEIPLTVQKVTLNAEGKGIEAAAREARYAVFADMLAADETLVTAHHQDDQCETLLLALKRGSGPAGLSAMPKQRSFAAGWLLRPLLPYRRQQLEAYAARYQLRWVEDDSNQQQIYDRNFLRLEVLPLLEQRWPYFTATAARSAELCAEQESLLDELLKETLDGLITPQNSLPVAPLEAMSPLRRHGLLRRWLAYCGAPMPSRAVLDKLWQEVALSREDANPRIVLGSGELRRYHQQLWWVRVFPSQRQQQLTWPDLRQPLCLPAGLGQLMSAPQGIRLPLPRPDEQVNVRFTATGNLHICGRERGRTLKKLWQESGIPPWQRETTPILFYGQQPVCAPGVFVTRFADSTGLAEDGCWHLVWRKPERAGQ